MEKTVLYLEPGDTYIWNELPRDDQRQVIKYVKAAPTNSAIRITLIHYYDYAENTFRVAETERMDGEDFWFACSINRKPKGFFPKRDFKELIGRKD